MKTSLFAGITVLVLAFAIAAPAASQTPQAGATTNMEILAAKLNGVIPATKIARYVQVENKIRAQINYELAASIPFVQ